jgi:hypothetical protein
MLGALKARGAPIAARLLHKQNQLKNLLFCLSYEAMQLLFCITIT